MEADAREPDLIPARMLNEYAYCPRLAYLEWVQGEFADNAFTEDGRFAHRRVDKPTGDVEATKPDDPDKPRVVRSSMMSAPGEGLIARVDLVEFEGQRAVPIDYKRGKKPDIAEGAYEPERVQLCAQGLILRELGFECDHGLIYFVASKERVEIPFDEALVGRTRALLADLRELARHPVMPTALDDSPKCDGCSLVGICLPDETTALRKASGDAEAPVARRLVPARDDALPLYVQEQGAYVSKSGEVIVVKKGGTKLGESRLFETSQVNLMGGVQISTAAVQELCQAGVPLLYFSRGGWFYGMTQGAANKNVDLRLHQYRAALSTEHSLALARRFVAAKIRNCRTMLRRNAADIESVRLRRLRQLGKLSEIAESQAGLLGIEGTAARLYFEALPRMLKRVGVEAGFDFDGRNRRPPRDPINAMLSLAYSLLAKDLAVTAAAVGFDPFLGFYHQPRYGRPSLALDLMEEFRPLIADSVVLTVVNNGAVTPEDFEQAGGAVALKPHARRAFIEAYERRMDHLVRHPVFGYQVSYRRVLEVQTRLLARHLSGEIPTFPAFATR